MWEKSYKVFFPVVLLLMLPLTGSCRRRGDNWSSEDSDFKKVPRTLERYHNYHDLIRELETLEARYPDNAFVYEIGKSVENRSIFGIRIASSVGRRKLLKPQVKIVANMHGNEVVGRELTIALAHYLLSGYDMEVREIVDFLESMDIHLVPSMNPDGFEKAVEGDCFGQDRNSGRNNADNVDLNRDFPSWDDLNKTRVELFEDRAPETRALMKYILNNPFVLSINFHDGSTVASYPYDDLQNAVKGSSGVPSKTPDNELFMKLAEVYARQNELMQSGRAKCAISEKSFFKGITNGAEWYVVKGGMQDFNYLFSNCFDITVELSCCKYPPVSQLREEWNLNVNSIMSYFRMVHSSVCGVVRMRGSPVKGAIVHVDEIFHDVKTSRRGEFWRLLLPGTYTVSVSFGGYRSTPRTVTIPRDSRRCVRIDFHF